jgi:hypothetical protein
VTPLYFKHLAKEQFAGLMYCTVTTVTLTFGCSFPNKFQIFQKDFEKTNGIDRVRPSREEEEKQRAVIAVKESM